MIEASGGVAVLTLDHPPLNVLTTEILRRMSAEIRLLAKAPDLRCLLLRGKGKAFCAGAAVDEHEGAKAGPMLESFHQVFLDLHDLDVPMVSAVQGKALGGGAELAAFADFVVMAETARLGFPEIRLGVFAPVAAAILPGRIGAGRARDLLFSGREVDAREALGMGLASRIVPDAELDAASRTLAGQLAGFSASSLRVLRQALRLGEMESFRTLLREEEALYLDRLMRTADAPEGIRSFLEKRPPAWSHR